LSIILKNNTENDIEITDIGITVDALGQKDISYKSSDVIRRSEILLLNIANNNITLNDGLEDLSSIEAIRFITGSTTKLQGTTYHDGRLSFHTTPRQSGLMTCFMGKSDSQEDETKVGGSNNYIYVNHIAIENDYTGMTPEFSFTPRGSIVGLDYYLMDPIYFKYNTIVNKTTIHDAIISWVNCIHPVMISVEVVPEVTTYETTTGTNYNLYEGYLIIPAEPGTGTINPLDILLIESPLNQSGVRKTSYWNADFNIETKQFENITPAYAGDGVYNMFVVEVSFQEFVCEWPLLGSHTMKLFTSDSEPIGHNMMFKFSFYTCGNHDWQFTCAMHMFREKTC